MLFATRYKNIGLKIAYYRKKERLYASRAGGEDWYECRLPWAD